MSDSTPPRCPRCNATVDANQEYCLECGTRLAHEQRPGSLERTSAGVGQRHGWAAAPWVVPALLGLVIAVLGTGAAIAISSDGEEPSAISTATGGSLTVTNDGSTLTAPEPTEPRRRRHRRPRRHRSRRPPRSRRQTRRRSSGPATGAAGRSCSSRSRSRTGSRGRTRRRLSCDATASAASASSTPTATRAFIPATTSSSPASSTPRRRRRVRSSERGPSATARRTSARSSRSPGSVGIQRGRANAFGATRPRFDSLAPLITIVNDFVTAPVVRILEVDHPRRNLIFGLCMGQNRER